MSRSKKRQKKSPVGPPSEDGVASAAAAAATAGVKHDPECVQTCCKTTGLADQDILSSVVTVKTEHGPDCQNTCCSLASKTEALQDVEEATEKGAKGEAQKETPVENVIEEEEEVEDRTSEHVAELGHVIVSLEDAFTVGGSAEYGTCGIPVNVEITYQSEVEPGEEGVGKDGSTPEKSKENDNPNKVRPEGNPAQPVEHEAKVPHPLRNSLASSLNEFIISFPSDQVYIKKQDKVCPSPRLQHFLDSCSQAPFGHNKATVIDKSVRNALCMTTSTEIKDINIDQEALSKILETVRSSLVPFHSRPLQATLDKVNVYGKGGMFQQHRDTPRDELCFGTLVLNLTDRFKGGILNVCHTTNTKHTEVYNWQTYEGNSYSYWRPNKDKEKKKCPEEYLLQEVGGKDTREKDKTLELDWCAFFGHCEHSIDTVESGHRITVTYLLRYDSECEVPWFLRPKTEKRDQKPQSNDESGFNAEEEEGENKEEDDAQQQAAERARLEKMNVPVLKDLCRSKGMKVGGSKAVLVDRLLFGEQSGGSGNPPITQISKYPKEEALYKGSTLFHALLGKLQDRSFFPEGGLLGVPCLHLYERAEDLPPNRDPEESSSDSDAPGAPPARGGRDLRLKGADAFVYLAGRCLGLRPQMLTVTRADDYEENLILDEWPSYEVARGWAGRQIVDGGYFAWTVNYEELQQEHEAPQFRGPQGPMDSLDALDEVMWAMYMPGVGYAGGKSSSAGFKVRDNIRAPKAVVLDDFLISGTGYFGNEASDGTMYVNAAVLLVVPPADARFDPQGGAFRWRGLPSREKAEAGSVDLSFFAGVARGLPPSEEEKAAAQRLNEFKRRKPWKVKGRNTEARIEREERMREEREHMEYMRMEYGSGGSDGEGGYGSDPGCMVM